MKMTKISILVDNCAHTRGILAEHGLSLLVEHDGIKILFDTGQSDVIVSNAETLGIELNEIDAIVLSHGHYDHTGGLPAILERCGQTQIYAHPGIFTERYSKDTVGRKDVGISFDREQIPDAYLKTNTKPVEIFKNVWLTGEVPRINTFEPAERGFLTIKDNKMATDLIMDDQSMFIQSDKGLIIILGCSHAGVVNILDYITKITAQQRIYAIIGGMHLRQADDMSIQLTTDAFMALEVQKLIPIHCTGFRATAEMFWKMNDKCIIAGAGDVLEI